MAACGGLQHIFEKPLPESPSTLLQSLTSWKHLSSLEDPSFTEFFGELHFKENTDFHLSSSTNPPPRSTPSSSSSYSIGINSQQEGGENLVNERKYTPTTYRKHYRQSDSFSSMNSESLSLCTEGLGLESCDDTEDMVNPNDRKQREARTSITRHSLDEYSSGKRSRITGGILPPPISCIGRTGKPWVCLKPYREDGRFVLKEVRIPNQEFLHACREDGRLKLQYIQSDDETVEEEEEEEDNHRQGDQDEHAQICNHGCDEEGEGDGVSGGKNFVSAFAC